MLFKKASRIFMTGGVFICFFLLTAAPAHAVIGDLNYNMPGQKQGETVVVDKTDTKALDTCRDEKTRTETLLKNCQGANNLLTSTQEELKNGKNTLLYIAIVSGTAALIFAAATLILFLKLKKAQAPAPVSSVS